MRLLSNLYKQRFITNESESRVINSNTLAYRILEEQSRALAKTREPEQPQAESGGFVEGIAAPQVETIDYEAEANKAAILTLLTQAKEKAEEILAQANAEADEIRKAAREEADEIRKQAQEQGQAEGLEQGMQEGAAVYDAKLESIGKREQQLQDSYLEQMRELEPKLVHTITDVVSHVFHVQFHDKDEIVLYLVKRAMESIDGPKEFTIKAGPKQAAYLEEHKQELLECVGQNATLDLVTIHSMTEGECIIETDTGVFECGMDVQLDNLIRDIQSLCM